MSDATFKAAVAESRKVERAVAAWLMKRNGCSVLPVYDYSGLSQDKAPKLQAFSSADSLVCPDLLVARRGLLTWVEVKWKTACIHWRKTSQDQTGIDRRLFDQYVRVAAVTGARVFLMFCHREPDVVTCDDLASLAVAKGRRDSVRSSTMPAMISWPIDSLHRVAKFSDIHTEA